MSGWVYRPWRGVFYPKGLRQADELVYAASQVTSLEVNGSFYSLQRPSNWERWRDLTPPGFRFAVKAPRFITHIKRLGDIDAPLANFLASGVLALGPKLGPMLWQFPPNLHYDEGLVERFLARLPRTTGAALELARGRDARMEGRELLRIHADVPIRHAIEPRSHSFSSPEFVAQCRDAGVAIVLGDNAGRWPMFDVATTDVAYARLHGDVELYTSGYDAPAIEKWAAWVRGHLAAGRETYVYFDNDAKVRAPVDAMALIEALRPAQRS